MFPFIDGGTWNPLCGECPHECAYCWAEELIKRYGMSKYSMSTFGLSNGELLRCFQPGTTVFVQDMTDLFAAVVPADLIRRVIQVIKKFPATKFLLMTKNPVRYLDFQQQKELPENVLLGITIESNRDYPELSKAPLQSQRLEATRKLIDSVSRPVFISVEPILDFDINLFSGELKAIHPWAVAVGYDNYCKKLPEPDAAKTLELIDRLESAMIPVYRKTLRDQK